MIGIALGVTVLITVLSVMNGFDSHIQNRVFSMAPAVSLSTFDGTLTNWPQWQQKLANQPTVLATAPFVNGQGLLRANGAVNPVQVQGILPKSEQALNSLSDKMVSGKLSSLTPKHFNIILGKILAMNLGLSVGDKVTLFIPKLTVSPAGVIPRFKRFTVSGIFSVGNGFGFDNGVAFINLQDAQTLFTLGKAVSGINLKIKDMYQAPKVGRDIEFKYPNLQSTDWTQSYGALFKAIAMEKTMMFLILFLIVAVAAFNMVSGLVMLVTDKQADIAILRTMGATPQLVMRIFMIQGCIIGFFGTFLGLVGGVILSLNVTRLVNWLQNILHKQLFQSSIYYLDYLPSQLKLSDITQITIVALILSLLATIYPAWKAARIQPAEALRYE
jgi:lipoprotein-releasing system permease protein